MSASGYRLQAVEIYNWGTFHQRVWPLQPGGHNALLTGDIGSGKSTLVDAITTLLVPHQRIVYNKAAGAEGRERSLYSYVRGEYKSEKDDLTNAARAVALRDTNHYSVLLARFSDANKPITLAQIFWLKDQSRTPERIFLVADGELTIRDHLSDFGSDIGALRKRLREQDGVILYDSFLRYANRFRREFGLRDAQALDLFYQTVSMKSVGNLTGFVRSHMLEAGDVEQRIVDLCNNFDNLSRLHAAVLKARRQVELLEPLCSDGVQHAADSRERDDLQGCRGALRDWFADHQRRLAVQRLQSLELQQQQAEHDLAQLRGELIRLRDAEEGIKLAIDEQGGGRLRAIEAECRRLEAERTRLHGNAERYQALLERLALPALRDQRGFVETRRKASQLFEQVDRQRETLEQDKVKQAIALREQRDAHQELVEEIASLRARRNNIPRRMLALRAALCEDLAIAPEALPFIGELLQVNEASHAWEGVAERLLHNFALSLLVPEAHYAQVNAYVDGTHLHGRLVYFRVDLKRQPEPLAELADDSLLRRLDIQPRSPFRHWLAERLAAQFDYSCCDDLECLRHRPRAITRNGLIRSGRERHEKDDRHHIDDRRRFVLGWDNHAKLSALEEQRGRVEGEIAELGGELARLQQQERALAGQRDDLRDLLAVDDYHQLAWQPLALELERLHSERHALESGSDRLATLRGKLDTSRAEQQKVQGLLDERLKDSAQIEQYQRQAQQQLDEAERQLAQADAQREQWFVRIEQHREAALGEGRLNLLNIDKQQARYRDWLQEGIDRLNQRLSRLGERIVKAMQFYKGEYPSETSEVDADLAALPDFASRLATLLGEDLPRHEQRFRAMLNEETIKGLVLFQANLEKGRAAIGNKIGVINQALHDIEYNPGSYIELHADESQDADVRDFRQQLRGCLSESISADELFTEERFYLVKAIIDRFNGREGFSELDRRWTRKVTDVRHWFSFSASERWLEDESEKEFYSDSAGKSGGQKEKLAYTVLASALAYQFGLQEKRRNARSFRFVMIDEAFGKGSDESTRYALELFRRLALQLLIVTPLQKIHVIEPYIRSLHFVHNDGGNRSLLRNLTIEEYREERARQQAHEQVAALVQDVTDKDEH